MRMSIRRFGKICLMSTRRIIDATVAIDIFQQQMPNSSRPMSVLVEWKVVCFTDLYRSTVKLLACRPRD